MRTGTDPAQCEALLLGAGIRLTRQRSALASLLFDGTPKHVTAEQVYEAAHKNKISVSLATVYNSLHQFTASGLLREVVIDSSRVYFDTTTHPHYHFFDEESGHLHDISAETMPPISLPTPPSGRLIERVDIIVRLSAEKTP